MGLPVSLSHGAACIAHIQDTGRAHLAALRKGVVAQKMTGRPELGRGLRAPQACLS